MTGTQQLVAVAVIVALVVGLLLATGRGRHGFAVAGRWSWSRWRRHRWASTVKGSWRETVRAAGLSRHYTRRERVQGRVTTVEHWDDPSLVRVRTTPHAITVTIRTRRGQTVAELEAGCARIAASYGSETFRAFPAPGRGSRVCLTMVVRDLLVNPVLAVPDGLPVETDSVRLGRRQDGTDWRLQLRERHTLVVGCSGSGKGSIEGGVVCGLAPAGWLDAVRLYGIDLKGGMELAVSEALFTRTAYDAAAAVELLRDLDRIANDRMAQMRGNARSFTPEPGRPLHVLVIDELAMLTLDRDAMKAGGPLLTGILARGRAVGVLVVAFVQDPRKEAIPMRGLFTQTVALRLRSPDETVMVFGDQAMAQLAPAHRILPEVQGTAYVVAEDGSADRVRADFWPDEAIREVANTYPAGQGRTKFEVVRNV